MKTLWNWMLGGALAASLGWNWNLLARTEKACAPCEESCVSLDADEIGLDASQRKSLGELCARTCGESDLLERRADGLHKDLLAKLAQPRVDETEVRALIQELGDLRRRSLEACVAGIMQVRTVLSPEQASRLLSQCAPGSMSCR